MPNSIWRGKRLGVIGGGNMAEALIRGVVASGLVSSSDIVVYDILPERRAVFAAFDCVSADDPAQAMAADVVLLATKPQMLREAVGGLAVGGGRLLVSIAAGVATGTIEKLFSAPVKVVRVMPNTPLLVGAGMSALCRGVHAGADDMVLALALFACCGDAVEVDEGHMDAVTALSGSGPAYLFRFAEVLAAAGVAAGLPPELAERLTVATLRGSSEMLAHQGDAAGLRRKVTSPGGTTAAALAVFERRDFAGMAVEAIVAARDRGAELGRKA